MWVLTRRQNYTIALQRFISFIKQGEKETNYLTLSLPVEGGSESETVDQTHSSGVNDSEDNSLFQDVIRSVPSRS